MAVGLNSPGLAHARALITSGAVDQTSAWSFSAADGNALLGDPPDWAAYAKWFMGHDTAADPKRKDAWKYPFGKNGKVYRSALSAIASRASAQGETAISNDASACLEMMGKPKSLETIHRAYSLVTVKAFDPERRTFSGIATSPVPDRLGDTIDSKGVTFKNPLPLLLYHNSQKPVGEARFAKATGDGTPFEAVISTIDRPGVVKDRLDEAVDSLSAKPPLIRGVSIGFRELEPAVFNKDTGGLAFSSIEVLELSMVVIPAHQDATIHTLKQFDIDRAASGTEVVVEPRKPSSGVSDRLRVVKTRTERSMKKSYADMIADCVASRKEKTDKIDAMLSKAGEAGLTLDEIEEVQHDTLASDVEAIDKQLGRYRAAEAREKASAVAVDGRTPQEGLQIREGARITVEKKLPPGIQWTRYAMCMGQSRGNVGEALRLAQKHYPDDSAIFALIEKSGVAGASTSGSHWVDDMIPYNVMNDFIEFLRPGSIIGKFGGLNPGGGPAYPSLNRVPFNQRVSGASTGLTAAWRGEALPAIPSAMVTFNTSLTWANIAALAILTKEAIRFSNPSAEARVRDDIARAINAKLDLDFVDPDKAVSANVSPASITNGIAQSAPTGTTAAKFRTDLATLLKNYTVANLGIAGVVLIMSNSQALELSMMINTLGNEDFPNINAEGGSIRGIPVITSEHLTALGSPTTQTIVAVKAPEVYIADDGVVTVEASDQASIEMQSSSSQSGISGTGANLVSLWQNGLVGLLATREITWKLRRSTAVYLITGAQYSA